MKAIAAKKASNEGTRKRQSDEQMAVPGRISFFPSSDAVMQRKPICPCGGGCPRCRGIIQTKLMINEPGDIYEQEADRIADQVTAAPEHQAVSGAPPRIQRLSGQSNGQMDSAPASVDQALASPGRPLEPALRQDMEQRFGHDFSKSHVHRGSTERADRAADAMVLAAPHLAPPERSASTPLTLATPINVSRTASLGSRIGEREATDPRAVSLPRAVHETLRVRGELLDHVTRTFMESRFGRDFSDVRVHTNAAAARSAEMVGAAAYTVGRHIAFAAERYAPHTRAGRQLLAHELAHVVQQGNAGGDPVAMGASGDDRWDLEADAASAAVMAGGEPRIHTRLSHPALQRQPVQARPGVAQCALPGGGARPCLLSDMSTLSRHWAEVEGFATRRWRQRDIASLIMEIIEKLPEEALIPRFYTSGVYQAEHQHSRAQPWKREELVVTESPYVSTAALRDKLVAYLIRIDPSLREMPTLQEPENRSLLKLKLMELGGAGGSRATAAEPFSVEDREMLYALVPVEMKKWTMEVQTWREEVLTELDRRLGERAARIARAATWAPFIALGGSALIGGTAGAGTALLSGGAGGAGVATTTAAPSTGVVATTATAAPLDVAIAEMGTSALTTSTVPTTMGLTGVSTQAAPYVAGAAGVTAGSVIVTAVTPPTGVTSAPDVPADRPMRRPPGGGERPGMTATEKTLTPHKKPEPVVEVLPRGTVPMKDFEPPEPGHYIVRKPPDAETQRQLLAQAGRTRDGLLRDANTGRALKEGEAVWGHAPYYQFKEMRDMAERLKWTQEQFDEFFRHPAKWQIEYGPTNSGRAFDRIPRQRPVH